VVFAEPNKTEAAADPKCFPRSGGNCGDLPFSHVTRPKKVLQPGPPGLPEPPPLRSRRASSWWRNAPFRPEPPLVSVEVQREARAAVPTLRPRTDFPPSECKPPADQKRPPVRPPCVLCPTDGPTPEPCTNLCARRAPLASRLRTAGFRAARKCPAKGNGFESSGLGTGESSVCAFRRGADPTSEHRVAPPFYAAGR